MTGRSMTGRCRDCVHFRNDPAYLENAFKGLSAMSSAWGSVCADDGLCLLHGRHLSADASCDKFSHADQDAA